MIVKNNKVIVTGGAGFIGSNLCKILAQNNFKPITVDNLSTGYREMVKYGDFIEADIGDYPKMVNIFRQHQPIAVMHIAGSKSVTESITNPDKYYENNVAKTNLLLKAMVECSIKNIIFSSTAAIFGIPDNKQKYVDEDHPTKPINPYGISKLMAENILESYDRAYNIKYSSLRYFNVTGADPELELGEIPSNPTNIFPRIISTIDKKQSEFIVFGDDYDTEDGTCVRDYIHVWDLVNAHLKALNKQLQTNQSIKINLGNKQGFSVKQVIDVFKKITQSDFKVKIGSRREGDPDLIMANSKLANDYLGWYPKYTNLEDHAKHSWDWYCKLKKIKKFY